MEAVAEDFMEVAEEGFTGVEVSTPEATPGTAADTTTADMVAAITEDGTWLLRRPRRLWLGLRPRRKILGPRIRLRMGLGLGIWLRVAVLGLGISVWLLRQPVVLRARPLFLSVLFVSGS
jgi:hypothetical protein